MFSLLGRIVSGLFRGPLPEAASRQVPTAAEVRHYRRLREAGRRLNGRMIHTLPRRAIGEVGAALGMLRGNTLVLDALHRLASLTGRSDYREHVTSSLDAMASIMQRASLEMAGWLEVGQRHTSPAYEVILAGEGDSTRELQRAVMERLLPQACVVNVPASGPDDATAKLFPPTKDKTAIDGDATAYVCTFGTCQAPTGDPSELRKQVMEGWAR